MGDSKAARRLKGNTRVRVPATVLAIVLINATTAVPNPLLGVLHVDEASFSAVPGTMRKNGCHLTVPDVDKANY